MQALNVTIKPRILPTMADTPELQAFSRRLNELCDEMGVPPKYHGRQSALAKRFGMSQKGARKWVEGEAFPDWEKLMEICDWGSVRLDWLLRGKEPKRDAKDITERYPAIAHVIGRMLVMDEPSQYLAARLVDQIAPPASPQPLDPVDFPDDFDR